MRRGCRLLGCAVLWALVLLGPIGWCQAAIVMDLSDQVGGGPLPPSGGPSWGTATFEDASPGVVRLTLHANLPTGYSIGGLGSTPTFGWGFNLDPLLNTQNLLFTYVSGNDAQVLHAANNKYVATGGGAFDFVFQWGWNISPPDPLVGTQDAVYTISASGLSATSFKQLSSDGSGGYYSAALVKGNGSAYSVGATKDSESSAIPEPATLVIWSVLGRGRGGTGGAQTAPAPLRRKRGIHSSSRRSPATAHAVPGWGCASSHSTACLERAPGPRSA